MAWKIFFKYNDGRVIGVGGSGKKLPLSSAKEYQKRFAKPDNDGGVVYASTLCAPSMTLPDYIAELEVSK